MPSRGVTIRFKEERELLPNKDVNAYLRRVSLMMLQRGV